MDLRKAIVCPVYRLDWDPGLKLSEKLGLSCRRDPCLLRRRVCQADL